MGRLEPTEVAALFRAHAPALVLYARQWLAGADAEDAVQEVFVQLAGRRGAPREPRAWLFQAVRRRAMGRRRKRVRRDKRERRVAEQAAAWFEPEPGDAADAARAQQLLEQLPEAQREAVILRLWGHLTLEEVARVVGCSVSAAHRRYHAAIEALREQMDPVCPGEDRRQA